MELVLVNYCSIKEAIIIIFMMLLEFAFCVLESSKTPVYIYIRHYIDTLHVHTYCSVVHSTLQASCVQLLVSYGMRTTRTWS